jgi:hypothetical protein
MFEQENALPRSQLHFAINNRHSLAGARQDHADMGWHVIAAFGVVRDIRHLLAPTGRRILRDHVAQSDRHFP